MKDLIFEKYLLIQAIGSLLWSADKAGALYLVFVELVELIPVLLRPSTVMVVFTVTV